MGKIENIQRYIQIIFGIESLVVDGVIDVEIAEKTMLRLAVDNGFPPMRLW